MSADCDRVADQYGIIIVGGGVAGSSLAALLARQGRQVLLLEKDRFPRDKLCGEFLSTEAQHLFEEIGCLDPILHARPARIHQSRFTLSSGGTLEIPLAGVAFGLSRRAVDDILFRYAASCGAITVTGAEVREVSPGKDREQNGTAKPFVNVRVRLRRPDGTHVTRELGGTAVIFAHGRRGALDKGLRRPFLERSHPYVGFKRHFGLASGLARDHLLEKLSGTVEIHGFRGGYCGLSFVEDGKVNVCVFLCESFLKRLPSKQWSDLEGALRTANPHLQRRLDALVPVDDVVHAVARVPLCNKERTLGSFLFIGDAAGMIAPMCGDGQSTALRSAIIMAQLFAEQPQELSKEHVCQVGRAWDLEWRREFLVRMQLGRWLQSLLLRPTVAAAALRALKTVPFLARALVRSTRGS